MKKKLHLLIFIGMIGGALAGWGISSMDPGGVKTDLLWTLGLLGKTLFIGALKMLVPPLIFFSILASITSLPTTGRLWALGWRTLLFYLVTTSIAVGIGLVFVLTVQPGHKGNRDQVREKWAVEKSEIAGSYGEKEQKLESAREQGALGAVKKNLETIIMNPFKALSEGQSLGIIFFAIFLGIALIVIGRQGEPVLPVVQGVSAAIMKLTTWIMAASPFFIFCIIAELIGSKGFEVFRNIAWYAGTVLGGIAVHVVVLLLICRFVGRMNILRFLRGIRKAWMIAFSTRSSAATLPVTIDCVQNELGVDEQTSEFVLPLGATVNMDGTALYEGVAVIFLIQLFGGMPGAEITLTPMVTIIIFLTAVLASIGAAAVPDAGLITMVLVANAVGLSIEYIPIIFAVDAFLDMFRTSTNVMGDSVGAVVISRLMGKKPALEEAN